MTQNAPTTPTLADILEGINRTIVAILESDFFTTLVEIERQLQTWCREHHVEVENFVRHYKELTSPTITI